MKNGLLYYYSLNVQSLTQENSKFYFNVDFDDYMLININYDEKDILHIYELLKNIQKNKYHQIIVNNQNQIITNIDNNKYVLLKYTNKNETIFLNDIINNNIYLDVKKYKIIDRTNWADLWSKKIDYFEYQIQQFDNKYPLIKESIQYYIGLTENAIQYSSMINDKYITLSHKRISDNINYIDFYNPLNLIIDYKIRDTAEYFKSKFINSYLSLEEVIYYIDNILKDEQLITFYTRMLYPSFYFDLYESIIEGKTKEKELLIVIRKTNDYEKFLKNLYKHISMKINIIIPEWLNL